MRFVPGTLATLCFVVSFIAATEAHHLNELRELEHAVATVARAEDAHEIRTSERYTQLGECCGHRLRYQMLSATLDLQEGLASAQTEPGRAWALLRRAEQEFARLGADIGTSPLPWIRAAHARASRLVLDPVFLDYVARAQSTAPHDQSAYVATTRIALTYRHAAPANVIDEMLRRLAVYYHQHPSNRQVRRLLADHPEWDTICTNAPPEGSPSRPCRGWEIRRQRRQQSID